MRFCSYVSITHRSVPDNTFTLMQYILTHCQSVFSFEDVSKRSTSLSIEVEELPDSLPSSLYALYTLSRSEAVVAL